MKRIVKIAKSSVLKNLKAIKDRNYQKRINDEDKLYLYKHLFGVNKIEIVDSPTHPEGKSIYVRYMNGTTEHVSTSDIVKREYFN